MIMNWPFLHLTCWSIQFIHLMGWFILCIHVLVILAGISSKISCFFFISSMFASNVDEFLQKEKKEAYNSEFVCVIHFCWVHTISVVHVTWRMLNDLVVSLRVRLRISGSLPYHHRLLQLIVRIYIHLLS